MRGLAGNQLYRLTADLTPQPLQDDDMVALATVSHAVNQWIQSALPPAELIDSLKEELARRKLVKRTDTAGEAAATVFDVSRRLHCAFARDDRPVRPSPRVTTYFLHFPTEEQGRLPQSQQPAAPSAQLSKVSCRFRTTAGRSGRWRGD